MCLTERARLGDLLREWEGDGALGTGPRLEGRIGEETCRRDTSPRLGDPTRLGLVGRLGDAGLLEPSILCPPMRELLGDMLFFLVYLGAPLCSGSGDWGLGGPGLMLCWGEVGGERGRGLYLETTGRWEGRWGAMVCRLGLRTAVGELVEPRELFREGVGEGSAEPVPGRHLMGPGAEAPGPRQGWHCTAFTGWRATCKSIIR